MQTLLATFVLLALVMFAMALGVMLTGRRLQGSCGGTPGKACACGPRKREACEARAAQTRDAERDAHRRLDVLDP
jgi:hypothetical protein